MGVSSVDIDVINRWTKKEAAGTARVSHKMRHHYADVIILLPAFERCTQAYVTPACWGPTESIWVLQGEYSFKKSLSSQGGLSRDCRDWSRLGSRESTRATQVSDGIGISTGRDLLVCLSQCLEL